MSNSVTYSSIPDGIAFNIECVDPYVLERMAKDLQPLVDPGLTASEALYGFVGWLSTRQEETVMGGKHECTELADLIGQFIVANRLGDPREGWERDLVHPV